MPLTKEQLEERRSRLGASDFAPLLGLSRWKTAYDIWLEKTGRLTGDGPVSQAAVAGNRFEAGVLDFAEETLGSLERAVPLKGSGLDFPVVANLDARVVETGEPCDAKTSGLFGPLPGEWGEEGTDHVPNSILVQLAVQIYCAGPGVGAGHVAAFLGGRGFMLFHIPRNTAFESAILKAGEKFWKEAVLADTPPDGAPSLEVAKLVRREPEKIVEIPEDLVARWLEARETLKGARANKEEADALLLAALGDAEASEPGPAGQVTFFETKRKGYTVEPTTFRQLRYRKPK